MGVSLSLSLPCMTKLVKNGFDRYGNPLKTCKSHMMGEMGQNRYETRFPVMSVALYCR